jgi:hypothetical protein
MPSDAESSSDDDAKTERRDPTPPPDGWMPGCPIPEGTVARLPRHEATATGLRLPIVTREEAGEEQAADDGNESDRYDKEAKEPKPKKPTQEAKKQQLRRWAFRYYMSDGKAEVIELTKLMTTVKSALNSDITKFKRMISDQEATYMCIEFHTSRRILKPKMQRFLAKTFRIANTEELLKSEEKMLAKEKPDDPTKIPNITPVQLDEMEDNTPADITTGVIKRLVAMEKAIAALQQDKEVNKAKMRRMNERIKELEKSTDVPNE